MEEATVAMATADVMVYDDGTKRWLSPDGCSEPARSQVRILHNQHTNAFRIVGTRLQDRQWILNCNVYERLKYNPATPLFHQWRDEKRKVYGLSFLSEEDARLFITVMSQALALLSSNNDYQNGADFGLSNGVYQEPQQLHHNAHSAPSFRDNDQDSICSAGLPLANAANHRKSSHSVHSSTSGGAAGLMLSSAQQRRSSQGSSSSSNGSSGPTTIYASSSSTCAASSPSRAAPSVPTPPAPPSNGPPPPPPLPSTGIASVSSTAPPAPPPPPPPGSLFSAKSSSNSIAEQLRNVQLRKTNNATTSNSSNGSTKADSLTSSGSIRGRGDLFSELEATLNKRKNHVEGTDARPTGEASSNGVAARRPWEKPSGAQLNGTIANSESPKTHRKAPSGSSLSSQEDARLLNGNAAGTANAVAACGSGTAGGAAPCGGALTVEVLEKWKQELLTEMRAEIAKAKAEIIDAIREQLQARR